VIAPRDPTARALMRMPGQPMNDELAKMGIGGYDDLKARKGPCERDLPAP
jgi:hypothetical protein